MKETYNFFKTRNMKHEKRNMKNGTRNTEHGTRCTILRSPFSVLRLPFFFSAFLLSAFCFLPSAQAQNVRINWNAAVETNPFVSVGSGNYATLEFYFQVTNANLTSGIIDLVLPTGCVYDVANPAVNMGGVALATPTWTSGSRRIRFSGVNVNMGQAVHYAIPIRATFSVPAANGTGIVNVAVTKSGSTIDDGTHDLSLNFARASILALTPDVLPAGQTGLLLDFGTNDAIHTPGVNTSQIYRVKLRCTDASVDSLGVSFTTLTAAAEFSDWKINGATPASPNFLTKAVVASTNPEQTTYYIKLIKADSPGGDGFDDGEVVTLEVKIKKEVCGTQNLDIYTCIGTNLATASPYKKSDLFSGSLQAAPSTEGAPAITRVSCAITNLNANGLVSYDGSLNMVQTVVRNNAFGPANNIFYTVMLGYDQGTGYYFSYIDTASVRYKIGKNGALKRMRSITNVRTIPSAYSYGGTINAAYVGKPMSCKFGIADFLNPGDSLYIVFGVASPYDLLNPINPATATNRYRHLGGEINDQWDWNDLCLETNYNMSLSKRYVYLGGWDERINYSRYNPGFLIMPGDHAVYTFLEESGQNVASYTGSNTSTGKVVFKFKLPKDIVLNSANPDSVKIYLATNPSNKAPFQDVRITRTPDTVYYEYEVLINQLTTRSAINIDLDLKNPCLTPVNKEVTINMSQDWYPTGTVTLGSATDVVFTQDINLNTAFYMICELYGVTFTPEIKRQTRGYKDYNNDCVPDDGTLIDDNMMDHDRWMYGDTALITWDAEVLDGDSKKVYAIVYSNLDAANIGVLANEVTLLANGGNDPNTSCVLKQTVSGDFANVTDRGPAAGLQRYAYIWEISQTDGSNIPNGTRYLLTIPVKKRGTAHETPLVLHLQMYASETDLSTINNILAPGANQKGEEVYIKKIQFGNAFDFTGSNTISYSTMTYIGSGSQNTSELDIISGINKQVYNQTKNEHRHYLLVDTLVVEVPEGYILPNTATVRYTNYPGLPITSTVINKDIAITAIAGDPDHRKRYPVINGYDINYDTPSKALIPDAHWRITFRNFSITATNGAPATGTVVMYATSTDDYALPSHKVDNGSGGTRGKVTTPRTFSYNNRVKLVFIDPGSVKVSAAGSTNIMATSSALQAPINVINTKTDNSAYDVWLYVEGPVENVSFIVGGVTYPYEAGSEGGRWIHITDPIAASSALTGNLQFTYLGGSCTNAKITVYPMFNRTLTSMSGWQPYPALNNASFNRAATFCYPGLAFTINNVTSTISSSITPLANTASDPSIPGSPLYGISTVAKGVQFPVEMVYSAEGSVGSSLNSYITATFPKGLEYVPNSAYLYNGTVNIPVGAAMETELQNLTGGATPVNLNLSLLDGGIPNGETPGTGYWKLRFLLIPTCNISLTPEFISSKIYGERVCGGASTGSGVFTFTSSPLRLTGAITAYNAVSKLTATANMFSCSPPDPTTGTLTFKFAMRDVAQLTIGATDSIFIILPKWLNINGNITFNLPAATGVPAKSGTVAAATINNTVAGNTRIVSFPVDYAYFNDLRDHYVSYQADSNRYVIPIIFDATTAEYFNANLTVALRGLGSSAGAGCPTLYDNITYSDVPAVTMPMPVVVPPANISTCHNETVNQIDLSGNYPYAGYGYNWSFGGVNIGQSVNADDDADTIPAFTAINTGTSPVTATVTITPFYNDCTGTAKTFTITVYPALSAPALSGNFDLCTDGTDTYTYTTQSGMSGYTWYIQNGTILSGATTHEITVRWSSYGIGKLAVGYSNGTCSTLFSDTLDVRVVPCKLLDCSLITDKFVTEDGYGLGYTHSNTDWDILPGPVSAFDSVSYFIDGDLHRNGPASTLAITVFHTGIRHVRCIAFFCGISDTCDFYVTVRALCPSTVSDIEGNVYQVVDLAGLCWTENLKATQYANGTPIAWAKPYYSPEYPNTAYNAATFGLLYTWYSAVNVPEGDNTTIPAVNTLGFVQGICPNGWHVPSEAEWSNLMNSYPAKDLKSDSLWLAPNVGTNLTGFNALPAGICSAAINKFINLYGETGWWSADPNAIIQYSFSYYCDVSREITTNSKANGLSVRCVMDNY